MPILYSTSQVASLFDVDKQTVRRWAISGQMPAIKFGKHWRFKESEVLKVLSEGFESK